MPPAMIRTVRVKSLLPAIQAQLPSRIAARLLLAATELRERLRSQLESGQLPIQSDTRALQASLFLQLSGGGVEFNDYAERLSAARSAYLANESHWRELIREFLDPDAYTDEHFAARVAAMEPLPVGEYVVSVGTMLAYGYWWEYGHNNLFTEQWEHRPWMAPVADAWAVAEMAKHFEGLYRGLI